MPTQCNRDLFGFAPTQFATATCGTIQLKLLKIGAGARGWTGPAVSAKLSPLQQSDSAHSHFWEITPPPRRSIQGKSAR
jgi:hypothetical protein